MQLLQSFGGTPRETLSGATKEGPPKTKETNDLEVFGGTAGQLASFLRYDSE